MLTNIMVDFHYMDENMMKKILTSMIRPMLEYAAVVWSPNANCGHLEWIKIGGCYSNQYINSRKCWIYGDMKKGHYESHLNPA